MAEKLIESNNEKYRISLEGDEVSIGNKSIKFEFSEVSRNLCYIFIDEKPYRVYLNNSKSVFDIYVNGIYFRLRFINKLSEFLQNSENANSAGKKEYYVKAPMPGLVTKILKKNGDEVSAGETVLFLEAMKMENAIKSAHHGILHELNVEENINIEKGTTLFIVK